MTPKVWHTVGMDLIGPLTETPRGNKYVITLTDYFSKWAEAAPLPDKTAHGVAKFIYSVSAYNYNYGNNYYAHHLQQINLSMYI